MTNPTMMMQGDSVDNYDDDAPGFLHENYHNIPTSSGN